MLKFLLLFVAIEIASAKVKVMRDKLNHKQKIESTSYPFRTLKLNQKMFKKAIGKISKFLKKRQITRVRVDHRD